MIFRSLFAHLYNYFFTSAGRQRFRGFFGNYKTILASPLFDGQWYFREYPHVPTGGTYMFLRWFFPGIRYAALHYLLEGGKGHCDPSPHFCSDEYVVLSKINPAKINPLVHYERYGKKDVVLASAMSPPTVSREETIRGIRIRAVAGKPVRVLFFVSHPAMFPARPLFEAMLTDSIFDARIAVVPDLRWGESNEQILASMEACKADMLRWCPETRLSVAKQNEDGSWPNLSVDSDIVCHASPYSISDFHYNPRWVVGRSILAIHVNYAFFRSFFCREVVRNQNYTCFWKVFSECEENLKEYREYALDGSNAEVIGYVKMDRLKVSTHPPITSRRKVLIALHHSIEGGFNDKLGLSNFLRYADYFRTMPARHPEIDFVFRPHPFLFTALRKNPSWGDSKVASWIAEVKSNPNVSWFDAGDYFPVFEASDAIVQDCGSWLMEWAYTGKPCCYMLKRPSDIKKKFTIIGRAALEHCDIAYETSQIERFLVDVVLGGKDPKKNGREEFRKRIALNWPHASAVALASIKRDLGLVDR